MKQIVQGRPATTGTGAEARSQGCGRCRFGVLRQPAATDCPAPLYLRRAFQWKRRAIEFCACSSGRAAQAHAEETLRRIEDGSDYCSQSAEMRVNEWIDRNPLLPTATGA